MSFQLSHLLIIAVGGALGAMARYIVSMMSSGLLGVSFPSGTFIANVIGSLFIGFLSVLFIQKLGVDSLFRYLLIIGFLGSFTTFSSFSLESVQLFQQGLYSQAIVYILSSVIFSILAVILGMMIARAII